MKLKFNIGKMKVDFEINKDTFKTIIDLVIKLFF